MYTHSGRDVASSLLSRFQKYPNFVGNYGNVWWKQKKNLNPLTVLFTTTNCIVPPMIVTKTGLHYRRDIVSDATYSGEIGEQKNFSAIIEHAKMCRPSEIETVKLYGFAHAQVLLADKVVEAVKSGAIKKFVVMAGCDGLSKRAILLYRIC